MSVMTGGFGSGGPNGGTVSLVTTVSLAFPDRAAHARVVSVPSHRVAIHVT